MKKRVNNIASYIAPVAVTLVVFLIVELLAWKITKNEIQQNAVLLANYFKSSMNIQLTSIDAYSYELMKLEQADALSVMCEEQAESEQAIQLGNRLYHEIMRVLTANNILDNVILYFPKLDKAVASQGYLDINQILYLEDLTLYGDEEMLSQRFEELFQDRSVSFFNVYNESTDTVECYYRRCIPFNAKPDDCDRIMLIRIDAGIVNTLLNEMKDTLGAEHVVLLTNDGEVFAHSVAVDDTFVDQIKEEPKLLDSITTLWGMTLCISQNETPMQRFIRIVSTVLLIGLSLAGVMGVAFAMHSHKRSVSRLSDAKRRLGATDAVSLDEAISNHLENARSQDMENMQKLEQQQVLINYSFLRDLLCHIDSTDIALDNLYTIYNVELDYSGYSLFAIPQKNKSTANTYHTSILQLLSTEDLGNITVFWTEIDVVYFFLLGYDKDVVGYEDVERFKARISNVFADKIYGNSGCLESMSEVQDAFRTLYQISTGKRFVSYYRFGMEVQELYGQLLDCLINDRQETLLSMLPTIRQHLQQEDLNNSQLCQRYAFLAQLYQAPEMKGRIHILDEMFRDMRTQTWIRCIESFVDTEETVASTQREQRQIAVQVASIIAEEYANPQLSLAVLASRLDVTPPYLSKTFKEKFGENISHYLSRVRIERAKQLIQEGNDNLNSIALSVGFLSDMNLIRVFKRMENETPGSFRKKIKQQ